MSDTRVLHCDECGKPAARLVTRRVGDLCLPCAHEWDAKNAPLVYGGGGRWIRKPTDPDESEPPEGGS
jgi:RNA polymerase-binding transcription factor DksA